MPDVTELRVLDHAFSGTKVSASNDGLPAHVGFRLTSKAKVTR